MEKCLGGFCRSFGDLCGDYDHRYYSSWDPLFPGWDQKLNDLHAAVASVYRVLTGIMGGYIAARLAPSKPMTHALILGFIGVVISSLGAIFMGGMGPAWYSIGLIVVSLPCSWLGAMLYGTKV